MIFHENGEYIQGIIVIIETFHGLLVLMEEIDEILMKKNRQKDEFIIIYAQKGH